MKLIEGERIHMSSVGNTFKLSIAQVSSQDYGDYYCRATNLLERDVNQVVHLTGQHYNHIIRLDASLTNNV